MTAEEMDRLRRVEALFDTALEYSSGLERDAYLREHCAADTGLLAEIRELLDRDVRVVAAAPLQSEPLPKFGPWQAIRLLGRGGMGVVYLAERADGVFQMIAAVKAVPLALASLDMEERFRRERQFLAGLEHPGIARLIDGGVTAAGLPYLVMEFVDGVALDRYCDAQHLDTRSKVGLMRQVLEALIYVHGRQVIHRDLKPSNILVDAAGNVKLLDFGTARLVDASGDAAITKAGVFAFTPDYASPEQAQGKPVTLASDIYSAGVLLYRLLTGRPPYRLPNDAHEAAAAAGSAEPDASGLDAPLDAVILKALCKNPEERYRSAAEMDAEASVERSGDRVNIVASLERAADGSKLWTDTYRRRMGDLSAIEADVTARIASTLGIAPSASQKEHLPPEQAHDAYLKANFEFGQGTLAANALAQQDLRRALEIDPEYAAAYSLLGGVIWNRATIGPRDPAEHRESEQLWQKAIQLDPDLAPAHVAGGPRPMNTFGEPGISTRSVLAGKGMPQYSSGWKDAPPKRARNTGGCSPGVPILSRGRSLSLA